MNTELRKLARNDFEKDLFKLMNNSVFGKTMENIRKHRDIKLVITDKKRSKLVSEPNYHTTNLISEDLSIIEMKKTKVKMNKPIYLGLSILEISYILMYEFWYDYMKPKAWFNQKAWLKPYIDMNTELRKLARNDFEKDLFKLMNNSVFGKTMENIRKHRDIKLVITDKKRSKLVSEPNYHTINLISEDLSIIEMKKTKVKMNKPIYLGLSILEISKILMYEFWYDYMKPKYNDNVRLCYMDTDNFTMNIKTTDFYKDISDDVDNRFDTSNYEVKDHYL